jgi:hypothetical protein
VGLVFVSCDDGSSGGNDNGGSSNGGGGGDYDDYTPGWPPNNVLSDFALGGLSQPAGMTNPKWEASYSDYISSLHIRFDEPTTDAVKESIGSYVKNYLNSNGWDYDALYYSKIIGGFAYGVSFNEVNGYLNVMKGPTN